MQFSAAAEHINSCMQLALSTTAAKDPLKSCLRIKANKGSVDLYTTTGESGTCVTIEESSTKQAGVLMVNAALFSRAIKECDGDVELSLKNANLEVRCGQKKYQLLTAHDDANFPFKEQDELSAITLNLADLYESIRLSTPAAGTIRSMDSKGITLEKEGKKLRVSAIDRRAAAGATSAVSSKSVNIEPAIVSMEFCQFILSLGRNDDELSIGINGGTVAVGHRLGYSYFPLLTGKPIESAALIKKLSLDTKPVLVVAGIFSKAVKSVLIMGDAEEGNKGRLLGKKGKIEVYCHSNTTGAAKDSAITAGDLVIDSWYNLRSLLDYLVKVDPEQELKLHTIASAAQTAVIIQHEQSVYWLTNCEPPHDSEQGKE